ncbi:Short-chain dehydrogenase/reductase family 16C member 6 [Operophtera brumata]|uniref:Short-chain dehydrogenase/reductase family 16C member 6 n=1 Tax=Operophtera brumata TaxID=104452 RepID=A0A0L7L112_OPEBR|nr:Short-chain dehydrogenase/reductase family 16C member 6 [Operophtera brumata]
MNREALELSNDIVCILVNEEVGLEDTVKLVKGIGGKCYGYAVDLASREDIYRVAKKQGDGHIVTIASMAGYVGVAKLVDYCSSKAAACGFDEALRVELEARGINGVRTSLICPYFIRSTGMFEEVNSRFVPQLNSNEVADRVILAIRTHEPFALIPGIVPWACVSQAIRSLVPDAVPHANGHGPAPPRAAEPGLASIDLLEAKRESRPMTLLPQPLHDRHV